MKRVGLVALLGAVALSGCGASNAGVAARVGDRVVTTSRLAGLVDRSLSSPEFRTTVGKNADQYLRAKLTGLIETALLEEAARRLGVTVADADVQARIDRFAGSLGSRERLEEQAARQGVASADLPDAVRDLVLTEAVGLKLVEDEVVSEARLRQAYRENLGEFDRARPAHILVAAGDRALAVQLARRARAGEDFAALARRYSTDDQTKNAGGDLGFQGRGALDPAFEKVLYDLPVGGIGGPVRTRFGWHVVKLVERRLTTYAEARTELRGRILAPTAQQRREALLAKVATELGVRVNPRFGRWDPKTTSVLAPPDELSSPVPSVSPPGGPIGPPGGPAPGGPAPAPGGPAPGGPAPGQPSPAASR